jgi:hypothetical protein
MFKHAGIPLRACHLLLGAVLVGAPSSASAQQPADDLEIIVRPYLWMPTIKGDLGVDGLPIGSLTIPVDESFMDYADQLQGALLLTTELRKGAWGLAIDGVWMRLGEDTTTPGEALSSVDIQMDAVLLSIAPQYQFIDTERVEAALLAGGRYVYVRQDMDLKPNYAAIEPISEAVVSTAADKLSSAVGTAVNKAKDDIAGLRPGPDLAGQVEEAIDGVKVTVDPSDIVEEILARGGDYDGGSLVDEARAYVEAVQDAVAERAADLVEDLSPIERQNPELVEAAIEKAAKESVEDLKKHVSSEARKGIEHAEAALEGKVESGMNAAASADAIESRDWIDPFIGLKASIILMDRLTLMAYGDIGGFDVGSQLTWQLFGGLSWQTSDSIAVEAGYRHLDIDYDSDHFIFDASMSGFAAGVNIRL